MKYKELIKREDEDEVDGSEDRDIVSQVQVDEDIDEEETLDEDEDIKGNQDHDDDQEEDLGEEALLEDLKEDLVDSKELLLEAIQKKLHPNGCSFFFSFLSASVRLLLSLIIPVI